MTEEPNDRETESQQAPLDRRGFIKGALTLAAGAAAIGVAGRLGLAAVDRGNLRVRRVLRIFICENIENAHVMSA